MNIYRQLTLFTYSFYTATCEYEVSPSFDKTIVKLLTGDKMRISEMFSEIVPFGRTRKSFGTYS